MVHIKTIKKILDPLHPEKTMIISIVMAACISSFYYPLHASSDTDKLTLKEALQMERFKKMEEFQEEKRRIHKKSMSFFKPVKVDVKHEHRRSSFADIFKKIKNTEK